MWYSGTINSFCMHETTGKEHANILEDFILYQKRKKEEEAQIYIWFGSYTKMIAPIEAKLLAFQDKYNEAIELLEKHKSIDSYRAYRLQLARYYQKIGNYKKAEENFKLILKKSPYDAYYNYYAALLYYDWNKKEKAKKHLDISLDIWKDADKDYIFSNMAKETEKEWMSRAHLGL